MKSFRLILLGVFFTVAFSWTGLILSSQIQYGKLERATLEEGELPQPQQVPGIALKGKQHYQSLGCMYCHTQQIRKKGFGADYERGWGDRQTVARDYILQERVLLGTMRTGPDLANVGLRLTKEWHLLHLYNPQHTSPGSIMPPFRYLFEEQEIGEHPHPEALKFPPNVKDGPRADYEIVPTERATELVEYLLSLKVDYELPESRFSE